MPLVFSWESRPQICGGESGALAVEAAAQICRFGGGIAPEVPRALHGGGGAHPADAVAGAQYTCVAVLAAHDAAQHGVGGLKVVRGVAGDVGQVVAAINLVAPAGHAAHGLPGAGRRPPGCSTC